MGGMPTSGASFALLTTGSAQLAGTPNSAPNSGANLGGNQVRGSTDFDVTVLKIDLQVPSTANCLIGLDFKFFSEEYPEYVGRQFNDAFIAEVDSSTWTTSGSSIIAPNNFAFDPAGRVISVNAVGETTMTAGNAAGTTYDGATPLLSAATPISPGRHSLYLSIFDQGDRIFDSAIFVDNLRFGQVRNPITDCKPGAKAVPLVPGIPVVIALPGPGRGTGPLPPPPVRSPPIAVRPTPRTPPRLSVSPPPPPPPLRVRPLPPPPPLIVPSSQPTAPRSAAAEFLSKLRSTLTPIEEKCRRDRDNRNWFGRTVQWTLRNDLENCINDTFVRRVADRFAGLDPGRLPIPDGVPEGASRRRPPEEIRGSSGWKRALTNDDESPARHFIGWFAIGYFHPLAANTALSMQERPEQQGSSEQDVRSGRIAIAIGIDLRRGRLSAAEAIRRMESSISDPSNAGGARPPERSSTATPWYLD